MKVSIIVPVLNEARTLAELLDRVWNQPLAIEREFVIVESNSTDGSRDIAKRFAEEKNRVVPGSVRLVLEDAPRGRGYAIRAGIAHSDGDIILFQDADLEYDPADYPALLAPFIENRADFVLGSRLLGAGTWKIRSFPGAPIASCLLNIGGVLFHGFFNILYGTHVSDPTNMYKVFRRDCLGYFTLTRDRFDFCWELVGKLVRAGFLPVDVPVSYHARGFAEGKKIRVFHDPPLWLRAIVSARFAPVRKSDAGRRGYQRNT